MNTAELLSACEPTASERNTMFAASNVAVAVKGAATVNRSSATGVASAVFANKRQSMSATVQLSMMVWSVSAMYCQLGAAASQPMRHRLDWPLDPGEGLSNANSSSLPAIAKAASLLACMNTGTEPSGAIGCGALQLPPLWRVMT
ncbi:hypothetical protein ABIE80_005898 [Bradyrhizobium diazoefficiens]